MHKNNTAEAEAVRLIEFHKAGYTGKGIKAMSLENIQKKGSHGHYTAQIIKQSAPDVDIFEPSIHTSKYSNKNLPIVIQEAIDNKVDIIFNALGFGIEDEDEPFIQKALDAGIVLVNAIGNENRYRNDETDRNKTDIRNYNGFIQVGAVLITKNDDFKRATYSNKGELLEYVDHTNIWTESGEKFTGTSCAAPWFAGKLACLLQFYYAHDMQNWCDFMEFVDENIKDLGDIGKDDLYGKGILIMPNPKMEVKYMEEKDKQEVYDKNAISSWAYEAWKWGVENELNDGLGAKNNITEEQFMTILKRYHDKFIEKK